MFIEIKDIDGVKSFNTDVVTKIEECPQKYVAQTNVYFTDGSWLNIHCYNVAELTTEINKQMISDIT